jgi:hypothetical protein
VSNPNIVNNNNDNNNNNKDMLTTTVANDFLKNDQPTNIQTKTNDVVMDCICCSLNNNGDNYIQSYNFGKKRETKSKR